MKCLLLRVWVTPRIASSNHKPDEQRKAVPGTDYDGTWYVASRMPNTLFDSVGRGFPMTLSEHPSRTAAVGSRLAATTGYRYPSLSLVV